MALRTGVLTKEQWAARCDELLIDIGKESGTAERQVDAGRTKVYR